METFENVYQYPFSVIDGKPFEQKGRWNEKCFGNSNPIILEMGCGKGEYTVGLAKRYPDTNFIGVDIKGARIYTGAKQALEEKLGNVAFLRTNIEIIDWFFAENEVQEIWLTFSDPQMKNPRKRLSSTYFLKRYKRFLIDRGTIHLKTDSNFLFTYTSALVQQNNLPVLLQTNDLYNRNAELPADELDLYTREILNIRTYYENQWIERGLNIKYIKFALPHDISLHEPDVEIEIDDYRSFKRPKRSGLSTSK